jgi:flagellar assembly factor FliW
MPVSFDSVRFGTVEVPERGVIDFPHGLIGLGGSRYALLDRNPGSGFFWLHCVDDPALALPVVRPEIFFEDFALELAPDEREMLGADDLGGAEVYVTVRASPDPLQTTANLRAPIVVHGGRGFQVLNGADGAALQAPLFELAADAGTESAQPEPADAA